MIRAEPFKDYYELHKVQPFSNDLESMDTCPLNCWLRQFVQEVANAEGEKYPARTLYGIICGTRRHLVESGKRSTKSTATGGLKVSGRKIILQINTVCEVCIHYVVSEQFVLFLLQNDQETCEIPFFLCHVYKEGYKPKFIAERPYVTVIVCNQMQILLFSCLVHSIMFS